MAPVTLVFGALLILLGLAGYYGTDQVSITALIPAFFGVAFLLLGGLAFKDSLRKHAMHLAAVLGLLGCLGAAARIIKPLLALLSGESLEHPIAFMAQLIMAVLCGIFVGLCVRSFIHSRRARMQREQAGVS